MTQYITERYREDLTKAFVLLILLEQTKNWWDFDPTGRSQSSNTYFVLLPLSTSIYTLNLSRLNELEVLLVEIELCVGSPWEILCELTQFLGQHRGTAVEHSCNIQEQGYQCWSRNSIMKQWITIACTNWPSCWCYPFLGKDWADRRAWLFDWDRQGSTPWEHVRKSHVFWLGYWSLSNRLTMLTIDLFYLW